MRHEVAIYVASAGSAGFYDQAHGRAGGAERQMTLLARALAEGGHRVAHITYEPREPVALSYPVTLVYRGPYQGDRRFAGALLEALTVWRALAHADACVVVVRTASPLLGVAALFCKLRRRRLVFSSSNVSDFGREKLSGRVDSLSYRVGVRLADAVVVQSQDQVELARTTFPSVARIVRIPSLAETALGEASTAPVAPEAFLWFGRVVQQKQPLGFVELARSLPAARFRMVAVPDGRDGTLLAKLRAVSREIPNLELLDALPHAELQSLVSRSVAVVNTSYLEGMPNAFLEAWARGVPVLTLEFDPDGVVARERLGISARGSWRRFVTGARELWDDRAEMPERFPHLAEYVERTHSPGSVAERWAALIEELANDSPARTSEASGRRKRSLSWRSPRVPVADMLRGRGTGPLVLEYHAVSDTWESSLAVTTARLRRQLEFLLERGYVPRTFTEAALGPSDGRVFSVTFDDAYRSVLEHGSPILASLGIPGTVFVVTDFAVNGRPLRWLRSTDWDEAFDPELRGMTWEDLGSLAAQGWEIGSHTQTHPRLTQLSDDDLARELLESREACERALGRPCTSLAYPFGDVDDRVASMAGDAGYAVAAIEDQCAPTAYMWPRVGIYRADSMARFRLKVSPTTRSIRGTFDPLRRRFAVRARSALASGAVGSETPT